MSEKCKAAAFTSQFASQDGSWEKGYVAYSRQCEQTADESGYCFVHKKSPYRQDFMCVQSEHDAKYVKKWQNIVK